MTRSDFTVTPELDGITVEEFLRRHHFVSRRLITALKRTDGGITRNGEFVRTIDKVKCGDIISLQTESDSPLEPNGLLYAELVYDDDYVAVFNKPANMPMHPSHLHQGDTLGNYFSYLFPDKTFRAVNRLDRDTSGLCVCAKSRYTANLLQGNVKKTYYAAVTGTIQNSGTIDAPIAREKESIITRCVREDGQRAVTHYKPILRGSGSTLLEIDLETGRTHQIRVHMAHIGLPLIGDTLYGEDRTIQRQALHCGKISFTHPQNGKLITLEVPLPNDIQSLFKDKITEE